MKLERHFERMTPEELRTLIRTAKDEIRKIELQLANNPDESDWRRRAQEAVAVRRTAINMATKVLTPTLEATIFMETARKLLDPEAFNTILMATRYTMNSETAV